MFLERYPHLAEYLSFIFENEQHYPFPDEVRDTPHMMRHVGEQANSSWRAKERRVLQHEIDFTDLYRDSCESEDEHEARLESIFPVEQMAFDPANNDPLDFDEHNEELPHWALLARRVIRMKTFDKGASGTWRRRLELFDAIIHLVESDEFDMPHSKKMDYFRERIRGVEEKTIANDLAEVRNIVRAHCNRAPHHWRS